MDFIKLKYFFIIALAVPSLFLVGNNLSSIFTKPDIKDINIPSINDFTFEAKKNLSQENLNDINEIKSFDYKVIGFRAGIDDSSVILNLTVISTGPSVTSTSLDEIEIIS